jgi:hypothetical protein
MYGSSFWLSHQNRISIPLLPHSCYMPRPCHHSWLDRSAYIWWRVQVMKLLIMQFFSILPLLIPLLSKHSPQHTGNRIWHHRPVNHPRYLQINEGLVTRAHQQSSFFKLNVRAFVCMWTSLKVHCTLSRQTYWRTVLHVIISQQI